MELPDDLGKFVEPIVAMCKAQFPRKCSNCKKEFLDFKAFVSGTSPVGAPQCSALIDDPLGLLSYVNCKCGSTVVLSCADATAHAQFKEVLDFEAKRTGLPKDKLLLALRDRVRSRMLEK
jgi:hypothetical protein